MSLGKLSFYKTKGTEIRIVCVYLALFIGGCFSPPAYTSKRSLPGFISFEPSKDKAYFYYSSKERIPIFIRFDQIALRPLPNFDANEIEEQARKAGLLRESEEIEVLEGHNLLLSPITGVTEDEELRSLLLKWRTLPAARFATPIFQYGKIRLVLTDELIVQFQEDLSADTIRQRLARLGLSPVKTSKAIPNHVVAKVEVVTGFEALEKANALHEEKEDIVFAEPNFVQLIPKLPRFGPRTEKGAGRKIAPSPAIGEAGKAPIRDY
jgi:hypothetical protein